MANRKFLIIIIILVFANDLSVCRERTDAMTLDQLRMLVKISETGGLAAVESLFRTQPTVSVAIKKLEDELGMLLLPRDGYRASLTS